MLKCGRSAEFFGVGLTWVGRYLRWREMHFYQRLADLPQVPKVLGTVGKTGFVHAYVRGRPLADGSTVQAIESVDFWVKEEQGSEHSTGHPVIKPYVPGRTLCAQGVYQGVKGKDGTQAVPLFSLMFAMDRDK